MSFRRKLESRGVEIGKIRIFAAVRMTARVKKEERCRPLLNTPCKKE
jgi:hypothetical protein